MNTLPAMRKLKGNFQDIGKKKFTVVLDVPLVYPLKDPLTYTFKFPTEQLFTVQICILAYKLYTVGHRSMSCYPSQYFTGTCESDHLPSLERCKFVTISILLPVSDFDIAAIHTYVLNIISYIGCSASIFGCVLLLLTF